MAHKENSAIAAAAAAPPRLSRAATVTAVAVAAKRKRVALAQLPTHPNAVHDDDHEPARKQRHLLPAARPKPRAAAPAPAAASDDGDPQLCSPYASDIYSYLRSLELQAKRRPATDYMAAVQFDVSPNMRAICVDWLVTVADYYKLVSETLHLTVAYIDRFLSVKALNSRQNLQLLGVSAMLVASKYEEIKPPNVGDICYVTDDFYSRQEILDMHSDILNALKFEMGSPTTNTFLRIFIRCAQEDSDKCPSLQLEFLGDYLGELCLLDYSLLRFLPSLVAASVVFVARLTLDPHTHPWSKKMQTLTGYKPSELKDCVAAIHQMQLNRKYSSMLEIREKYKQPTFMGVSALRPPVEIPASYFKKLKEYVSDMEGATQDDDARNLDAVTSGPRANRSTVTSRPRANQSMVTSGPRANQSTVTVKAGAREPRRGTRKRTINRLISGPEWV